MSRIIAIDYGLKRVGIAITDITQTVAFPLTTVNTEEFLPFLKKYCQEENVETIILGEPRDVDSEADIVIAIKNLYSTLKKMFKNKKIITIDERYSSKIASFMINKYITKKKIKREKKNIDKISALIILQSYLFNKDLYM